MTQIARTGRPLRRLSFTATSAALLLAAAATSASATPRAHAAALAHAASVPSPQILAAADAAASAERQLVSQAIAHGQIQQAGTQLAQAQRRLATIASAHGRAHAAAAVAPVLTVDGEELKWSSVHRMRTYIVLSTAPDTPAREQLVKGTSFTPPAVPGTTVTYSVRTTAQASTWSRPRPISYPGTPSRTSGGTPTSGGTTSSGTPASGGSSQQEAPIGEQAAPSLTVSGQTLSWNAIPGVATYVLDRKVAGEPDQYTVVAGTSTTPAAVPGVTAHYSVRTAVYGSAWSREVAIVYPAEAPAPPPSKGEAPSAGGETPSSGSGETPVSVSSMWTGVDAGGWPSSFASDIAGAASTVRLENPSNIAPWTAAGLKVIDDMSGPYNTGGVSAINATEWAEKAVAWYRANPQASAIEILNEPGNQWIGWGSSAGSQANAAAYDNLLKTVHEMFVANFGSHYPALLASYDGGEGPTTWGEEMWKADPNVGSYINGITMHSYGGTSSRSASALGSRQHIEQAHSQHPGIPIYITEVGWPTALGQAPTGDSLQWSELEQAANITGFITWAQSTGYIADVTIFNYRDYGSNDWYGIESASGQHKLSYAALAAFSH